MNKDKTTLQRIFPNTHPHTRKVMQRNTSKDTKPEIIFRKAIWKAGYRYKKNNVNLPGKPDLFFSKAKLVIFIDGDFWHGFNWENKKNKLKRNAKYWISKIEYNIERDKKNTAKLKEQGFYVVRFWEHDIINNLDDCLNKTKQLIAQHTSKKYI